MNELVPLQNNAKDNLQLLANEIIQNPNKLQEIIKVTSQELEAARTTADEIASRSFLKRLISSNTKDFAKLMVAQNEIMSKFFLLLQVMTFLCKGNSVLLFGLMDSLDKGLDMSNEEQKNLYTFAKSYLQEAIESAKSEELRETALKKLLIHSNELKEFQHNSTKSIEGLSEELKDFKTQTGHDINQLESQLNTWKDSFEKELDGLQNKTGQDINKLESRLNTWKDDFEKELTGLQNKTNQDLKTMDSQTKSWKDSIEKDYAGKIASLKKRALILFIISIIAMLVGIIALIVK